VHDVALALAKAPETAQRGRLTVSDAPSDISGPDEVSRRVSENLRRRRKLRDMSLDDLARASGVSRAALSQIETRKTNPTIGILWKIAVGLGLPFAELIGEPASTASVVRRKSSEVLRSVDGKFMSRPLAPSGASPLVELYELTLLKKAVHASEAHALGTREQIVVLDGTLRMRVGENVYVLEAGDSVSFLADVPHSYENAGPTTVRVHNVIIYSR
jgi:XRE family transcriptional regulator, regulator of sulfur utilization